MDYNPFDPETRRNPYPSYAALRRDHPVYRIEAMGAYAISRYDDVARVLMHPELFSSRGMGDVTVQGRRTSMMIGVDPPDHTRLRNLVNRSFTPKMVADLEPRIRELTNELLDRVAGAGRMDLIGDLAVPLPVTIIAQILGVDPAHNEDFKRWSDHVVQERSGLPVEDQQAVERDMEAFQDYFIRAVEERRARPREDMISALVLAHEEQGALSSDEVLAFIALLLIAGNETTTNLLGNAMIALLDHPYELAEVRADPSLVPSLVEEALRYDAPVQFLFRLATQDTEIAGTPVPQGAPVLPIFASANRDDRRYPDGDRFDVTRDAQGHLAFGHGIHFCLGAPLARLEGRIALEGLLARFDDFERAEADVPYVESIFLRGPTRLPLTFRTRE
jgi:cytochrome P450